MTNDLEKIIADNEQLKSELWSMGSLETDKAAGLCSVIEHLAHELKWLRETCRTLQRENDELRAKIAGVAG